MVRDTNGEVAGHNIHLVCPTKAADVHEEGTADSDRLGMDCHPLAFPMVMAGLQTG